MSESLEQVRAAHDRRHQSAREQAAALEAAVYRARYDGHTWEQIGAVLGITRQAAQQMYGRVRVIEGDQ